MGTMDVVSLLVLILSLGNLFYYMYQSRRLKLNTATVYEQIERLVLANNIDRAIRLCNSIPEALATRMMKMLLLLASNF